MITEQILIECWLRAQPRAKLYTHLLFLTTRVCWLKRSLYPKLGYQAWKTGGGISGRCAHPRLHRFVQKNRAQQGQPTRPWPNPNLSTRSAVKFTSSGETENMRRCAFLNPKATHMDLRVERREAGVWHRTHTHQRYVSKFLIICQTEVWQDRN